ncbi:CoA pyrophosphatase [Sporosarcina sp. HYO08]|uniref:NUDIX hydrolase n=1 Tax=Sporosarcina sp. HYO08 TaxID=1759557 RepID=UPI00079A0C38|nr:CoA pyrophosphatase [Sporosarcina sp. HYO08]KXH80618.1 coenzyme A pyrophosphatase [Sporosarcina sp. HYO08]
MFLDQLKKQLDENQSLFIGEETAFRSAVLIPLVQVDGEWHILFEVRAFTMRRQPGDISFPGGRIDSTDSTPWAAALRETHEELGVDPQTVKLVRPLSPYIASPEFVVFPFVATIDYSQVIHSYNKKEVEEVFTVPVKWLLNHEPYMHMVSVEMAPSSDFPFEKIVNGAQYQWRTRSIEEWFFEYEEYTIWGLTARILKHFLEIVKKSDAINFESSISQ